MANTHNEAAMEAWPNVYQSDFAVAVAADVRNASEYGRQFWNNDLNGPHPGAPGHHTSKTRVCVTVAMMTTGYDCPNLLNIISYDAHWNDNYDVIMANPPLMTPTGAIKPNPRFYIQVNKTEAMFVDYIASHP